MGIFGGFVGWVKEKANNVVKNVKESAHAIKEKVTNVWNSFSGKINLTRQTYYMRK